MVHRVELLVDSEYCSEKSFDSTLSKDITGLV